jgi:signal transduction histidine kinase
VLKLLAFARQTQAHLILLDAYQHVNDFIGTLKDLLPQSVELATPGDKVFPPLFADPEHINRLLANLIQNAREALPQGEKLRSPSNLSSLTPFSRIFLSWKIFRIFA